jgi:cobalt-zinc-cadmium efflux system membrane fusion protein
MKKIQFIFITILFLQACGDPKPEQDSPTEAVEETSLTLTNAQFQSAGIQLGHIANRDISSTLRLNGKIDVPPQNMVSVSTPFGGFLKSTHLLPGMRIKKGEIIATMEDQQYIQLQQDYLTAKSKLKFLESEYNRQKDLNQSKASSDKILQQTEMEFNTQKIILSSLAQKLRLINVDPETLNENNLSRSIHLYSTIDGFVSHVNVNIGKYLNPSDILFELINPEDIHLNLKVFEKDLSLLAIGQNLLTYNNNNPEKKYPCEIILIGQDLAADRSTEVHCHFENYDKTLFPGMYMNAEIEIKIKNVPSIPDEAIVNYQGKDFIFISNGKLTFEMLAVKKGSSENNFTEIGSINKKDLSKSTVVTKGAYSLLMQLKNKSE